MRQGIVKNFLRSHFDKEGGIKDNGFRVQGAVGRAVLWLCMKALLELGIRNEELGMVVRREK